MMLMQKRSCYESRKERYREEKEELLTFINSEKFDTLPLEDQLRWMQKAGQALIDFAHEVQQEIGAEK